jgi:protein FrlC
MSEQVERWLDRKQIAGMNCHYIRYSLEYFLEQQARLGITSIALWGGAPHISLDRNCHSDGRKIKKLARALGLTFTCFTAASCTYGYQYCSFGEEFERSRAYFFRGLELAHELEIPYMAVNSGWGFWNEDREEAFKRSAEMLWQVAEKAAGYGVTLTMESLRRAESQLVYRLTDARRMMDEVNHPALQVMIDTTAMAVAGEQMEDWFLTFGDEIKNMHFVDGTPYGHLAWGDGNRDLAGYMDCMRRHHYRGQLGLELTDARYQEDPAAADRKCLEALAPYLKEKASFDK